MNALACSVALSTARIFGHPLTVLALTACALINLAWFAARPSELAFTILLSVLALQVSAAILWSGDRDTAELKRALAALVVATDGADDAAAPATDHLETRRMG